MVSATADAEPETGLFAAFDLGALHLPNRVVMAPMTRSRMPETVGNAPTAQTATYYAQRASSGLIVTESVVVHPTGRGYLDTPGLYSDEQQAAWAEVTAAVHTAGGRIVAQLWHVGRVAHHSTMPAGAVPVSATDELVDTLTTWGVTQSGRPGEVPVSRPTAATTDHVDQIVDAFAEAARRAVAAGFDGVEILGGNGYLFDQFMNAEVNHREDDFGGRTPAGRTRLLLHVVDAILDRSPGILLGVRLSPFGRFNSMPPDPTTGETFDHLAAELGDREVAYVHFDDHGVPLGHLNEGPTSAAAAQQAMPRLIGVDFLRRFKAFFGGPVVLCGGLDQSLAETFLDHGVVDLVAFGRPYIGNPDLVERLQHGWPLAVSVREYFYGGDERGYIDYPRHESSSVPVPREDK